MQTRITSQPQSRMKSEKPMRICVRSGSAALEFSNWRTIFGTTNSPFAFAGALRRASSLDNDGEVASGRVTLTSGTA